MRKTDDAPSNVIAFDAFDDLRRAVERGIGGNGNGGDKGDEGGRGDDPLRGQPVDGRVLIDALKQMADFTGNAILISTEKQTDFNLKTSQMLTDGIGNARQDGLELGKQLHTNMMAGFEQIAQLASVSADRFEALERQVRALEAELAALKQARRA